ncbi:MAG TPA: NERD domain-containing protein [Sulfurovum sp.]|nr:NERD domain-containing protein [Sulfurovum sp.]
MINKIITTISKYRNCNKINPVNYDNLLRSPGQSLDEEIEKIQDNLMSRYINISVGFFFFSIFLILNKFISISIIFTLIYAISFITYAAKIKKKIRDYRLGCDGEKSVAQYLSIVARQVSKENSNMHIYHDLVDEKKKFNIDHVVVSKKGIFIVETKTYRKDKRITNKITSNGKELFKNGHKMINNIPLQVKGQVQWLQSELLQTTGKKYEIISTIAFVGWYVEGDKIDDIYITQAKTLKNIFEHQYIDVIYDDEELKRITSCIHKLATVTNKKHTDICK